MTLKLNTLEYGEDSDQPTLVIAHGLFGSARNWGVLSKRLSMDRKVIAVDMRNHGTSPWADENDYAELASDLADVVTGPFDILGHSMGGKAAMALALQAPGELRRLIVADIAPVVYSHDNTPLIDAMERLNLGPISTRRQADQLLSQDIDDPAVRAFLLQSLDIAEKTWRLNLSALRDDMAKIIGFPDFSGDFVGRALFVYGGASDYVAPYMHPKIKAMFPQAEFAEIAGAGHWLHAEKPREFEAEISTFLAH